MEGKNRRLSAGSKLVILIAILCLVAMPSLVGDRHAYADPPAYSSTLADILALPDADVIPSLIKSIRNDPLFRDDDWKHQAYELLVSANGANSRAGVRQSRVASDAPCWHDPSPPRSPDAAAVI